VINDAAPDGLFAVINVGGSVLGIGTCLDAYGIPSGIITRKLPCDRGVTGLVHDFAARNVPVLHLLYVKRLALDWGLPYDPKPLPDVGENKRVYGRVPLSPEIQ
jgi:poly-gamma-glutamate system protein